VADKSDDTESQIVEEPSEDFDGPHYWLTAPATYCDYFVVDAWVPQGIVRLALGEVAEPGRPPLFRLGIAMPIADARELAETLIKAIQAAPVRKAPPRPASKT